LWGPRCGGNRVYITFASKALQPAETLRSVNALLPQSLTKGSKTDVRTNDTGRAGEYKSHLNVVSTQVTAAQLILATIAQRYQLRLVPGHPVEPQLLVSLRPKYGLRMTIHER
jgi:hypothetical protein